MKPPMLVLIVCLSFCGKVYAQKITSPAVNTPATKPPLSVDEKEFDFGSVGTNTSVTQQIEIVNNSDKPFSIKKVYCSYHNVLDPESYVHFDWPKKPIKPGKRSAISVTYKAMGDIGSFKDEIAVTTNDGETHFYLTGAIVPVKDHPTPEPEMLTPLGAVLGAVLIANMGK